MTIDLFPSEAARSGAPALEDEPLDPSAPEGRWVLHRAGILNVWQYDRVELRFAGGRMLLRGKNGAGKSKALEMLLPFLLDGDTRLLDATGRDRTTVTWLMTDGRPDGNHLGYVWLELRCGDAFLTLGAGLKASTAARRSDCWFFITDKRVGVDLDFDVAGECLSIERLRGVVGEEAVTQSGAEHRRRVGRQLFGLFDEARYRNLLHLLHRLRDPNIGNRVEAGELANVLTDALPPVDDRVLLAAASHFDDLDTIRDQVERASKTARALGEFLGAYRGYTRTVLARRAAAVEEAESRRARAARRSGQLAQAVRDAEREAEGAEAAVADLRQERTKREAERRELEFSDGYRAHLDLADRQEKVAALDTAAAIAESAAGRAGAALDRARADVEAATGEVQRSLARVREAREGAAGSAADAGLDPALLGAAPVLAAGGDVDAGELAQAEDRARAARTLAEGRRERASSLRAMAARAAEAERAAAAAEGRAAASEADVERDREALAAARAAQDTAELAWAEAVAGWLGAGLAAEAGADWAPARDRLAAREGEPTWPAAVLRAVTGCLESPLRAARARAAAADAAAAAAEQALAEVEARIAEVEAQAEAHPEPARHREAERDPAAGAPLYELVDIAPGVDPAAAAGLEAALEASGLLDAWVQADGLVVHPDTRDTLLRTDAAACPAGTATLADVLVPAPGAGGPATGGPASDGPVSAGTVAAVLRAVGLGEHPGAPAWVTTGGRWSLGVLRGAWHKDEVEYLGAPARRATCERLLARLRADAEARRADLDDARSRAAASASHRDALEALPSTLPRTDAIDEAEREVRSAERDLAAARARHDADRRGAEEARAAANRLVAAVADGAAADGLPTSLDELDTVLAALDELRQVLSEHRQALRDLARDSDRLRERRAAERERDAEAAEAAEAARQHRAAHATAAHELATLQAAVASTVDAVLARHRQVCERLDELEASGIPQAEQALREADREHERAAARLEEARQAELDAAAALAGAGQALRTAVGLPGVLLAATGTDELGAATGGADPVAAAGAGAATGGDGGASATGGAAAGAPVGGWAGEADPVALAGAVAPLVAGDDEVSDGTILSRYDRLNEALAEGYDTAIDEVDGVKVVHVADDTGRQPLAVVAARLAEEASAARGRLAAREREVLERFLLRELADEVRSKLLDAHDLVSATNRTLAGVRTSHGKGAHLDWKLRDDAAAPAAVAARLLLDDLRDEAADAQLRDALLALIDAERAADPSSGYEQHLRAALDYRAWHRFAVKVTDAASPGSSRTLSNRLGLSQGEQRVLSYLALFAAAAAHFEAIARDAPSAPRLLLLDDAFAKVDEPTHAHLLGLLVELGLDFVITSERMWGCFPTVPSLEIYEAVRDPAHPGVALVHFRWDGRQRHLVGV
jgi:uncharacterized protein (TIGR02680 family)